MAQPRRKTKMSALEEALPGKRRKPVPYAFVLDAIAPLSPYTRPMFGCLAIYVGERIVLILRDKLAYPADNGVWLATTKESHESLRREFPSMRSIELLGKPVTGWQVLPADASDFEAAALHACELVVAGDPRIGKVPGERAAKSKSTASNKPSRRKRRQSRDVRGHVEGKATSKPAKRRKG